MSQSHVLRCPVCARELEFDSSGLTCSQGHRFDRAREGYFNLLRSHKAGDSMGDPKSQARSRRDFLNRGYYAPLKDDLMHIVTEKASTCVGEKQAEEARAAERSHEDKSSCYQASFRPDLTAQEVRVGVGAEHPLRLLDICCGEGYFTAAMGSIAGVEAYGFDLGKEMVRLAAKRGGATYFVANMKSIPVDDGTFDVATHLFAPFNEREFARVLAPGGSLFTVVPGARHLWGLKSVLYDTPYLNDERLPACGTLALEGTHKVSAHIDLATREDIEAVFQMTPYYFRTKSEDRKRLGALDHLETDIEFVVAEYRKPRA